MGDHLKDFVFLAQLSFLVVLASLEVGADLSEPGSKTSQMLAFH